MIIVVVLSSSDSPWPACRCLAHHGWSSFDQDKPLFLSGTVKSVRWQNPHVEFVLVVAPGLVKPADLAGRKAPAQSQSVDGSAVLGKAAVPAQADWRVGDRTGAAVTRVGLGRV